MSPFLLIFSTLAICIEILIFYRMSSKHCNQWELLDLSQIRKTFCKKIILYNGLSV